MLREICLIAVAGIFGCARYDYLPTPPVTQLGAAAGAARGQVRVASLGVQAAPSADGSPSGQRAIHLRMSVANRGDEAWTIDPRLQEIDLPGRGPTAPVFARTSSGVVTAPVVIAARSHEHIDLYYPLDTSERPAVIPRFDARWQVQTPNGTLRGAEAFRRVDNGPTMPCGAHAPEYCLAGYAS